MPICGLILTLNPSERLAKGGILELSADQRFTLGEPVNPYLLPAVLEATSPREAHEATEWAQSIEGIREVNVISVDFQTDPHLRDQGDTSHD